MDLLDSLLSYDTIDVSESATKSQGDATSAEVDDAAAKEDPEISSQDQAWLTSGPDKKSASNVTVEFWDTKIQAKIHPSKLVWAKNNYFKGNGGTTNHFPARICDDHEGMYLSLDEWPIPEDKRLVEFLSIPKRHPSTPQKLVVMWKDIVPYHARVSRKSLSPVKPQMQMHSGGSSSSSVMKAAQAQVESELERKQQSSMLTFTTSSKRDPLRQWNLDSMENMTSFIYAHYSKVNGSAVERAIKKKAEAYLKASLAYAEETDNIARQAEEELLAKRERDEEDKNNNEGGRDSSSDDGIDIATFARQDLDDEAHIRIRPGSWLAYTHKIFKKIMYTRVVQVKSKKENMPLVCENGEVFGPSDQVRVMNTLEDGSCDKAEGSSYKQLSAYRFKKGKCKTLLSLHESSAESSKNDKLDLGGGRRHEPAIAVKSASSSSSSSSSSTSASSATFAGKRTVHALTAEESGSSDDDGLVRYKGASATSVQEKRKRLSMNDYLYDSD
jgi:hypothetical protein